MHPAIVVGRLRVLAGARVIVSGQCGILHAPQGDAIHFGKKAALADGPVCLVGRLVFKLLLDHGPEHVRDVFVQGARLPFLVGWAGVLCDGMLCASG